jgi:hypothetical protein
MTDFFSALTPNHEIARIVERFTVKGLRVKHKIEKQKPHLLK